MTNNFIKRKYTAIAIVLILTLVVILVPGGQARAVTNPVTKALGGLLSIGDITSAVVSKVAAYLIQIFVEIFAKMMRFFAGLLDTFVKYQNYNLPVVQVMWNMMKNFVSMFFILILIIISFATIFDVAKYSYKAVLPTLIVVALLMNFSLVIGQTIISTSDLITNAFLAQIKGGPDGLSGNLMSGFSLQNAVGTNGKGQDISNENVAITFAKKYTQVLINLVFLLVLMVIALLAFIVAAIFVFIRTPILMFLLILSPAAAFLYILPSTRQYFTKWWNAFISWVFFLPVYVFFLMFAIIFINTRAKFPNLGAASSATIDFFNFNDIFFYVVTLLFMIVGLSTARKVGSFAAGGVTTMVGKIDAGVKKYTPGARYWAAIPAGLKQTGQRIQEEGLPGRLGSKVFEGEQASKQRAARVGEKFQTFLGYRPNLAAQKEFSARTDKEFEYIKQQYDLGQIDIVGIRNGARQNADTPKGYAFRRMLAEMGQLDPVTARQTIMDLQSNPYAAANFVKSANKAKWSAVPSADVRQMAAGEGAYAELSTSNNYLPARREIYKYLQDSPEASAGFTPIQFETGVAVLGGATTADGTAFLKEIGKVRPDLVADFKIAHPVMGAPARTREQHIAGFMTNPENISNMPITVWGDIDFQRTLYDRLQALGTMRSRTNFRSNLERLIQESGRDVLAKQAIINAQAARGAARP